jgi:hypothetical protein
MKVLLPLTLLAATLATPAFADCTAPVIAITVPDGAKATMEQMLAAQHAIRDTDAAVQKYGDCLKAEQDAKIAAGGDKMKDEDKVKISAEYVTRQNAVADQLQKIADQFNVEVRAYKAKTAAAAGTAPPAPPAPAAKP